MKIQIQKEFFLENLALAVKFTSSKFTAQTALSGVYLKIEKEEIHFYSSNLNSYFHSLNKMETQGKADLTIEPRKIIEFVSLLPPGKVEFDIQEKQVVLLSGKTKGAFPLLSATDFPLPPKIKGTGQKLKADFLSKSLPLVLFATSQDETRPTLNGVQFQTNGEIVMVATDGFRLSLIREKKDIDFPSVIVPGDFLEEVLHNLEGQKETVFSYSEEEKMVMFKVGEKEFYSRLIQGEFPAYEKVIPAESTTSAIVDREELLRNIKLISIFAREFSNVVILDFKKGSLSLRPKIENQKEENIAVQEGEIKGTEQKIAFNFRFLLEFLSRVSAKKIVIEILRPDAPAAFKLEGNPNYLHIIMPVRIQE